MSDYAPNTDVIRQACTFERNRLGEPRSISVEAFERWLESVKREAAASALEEARDKIMPPYNWNLDPYTGNERPGTSGVDEVYNDVHRDLTDIIEATRNPRTPGEETT